MRFRSLQNNQVKQAIQVSYDISSPKTRKREIDGLLLAHKKTKCTNLLLLTDHEYSQITENKVDIKIQPVYDWVLEIGKRKERIKCYLKEYWSKDILG